MDIGIVLPTTYATVRPGDVLDFALDAERLGFHSVWVVDHLMVPRAAPAQFDAILESLTTLSWVAAVTRRVRLGTSVLVLPQRDPITVAKQVATLDQLSDGRAILGVGVGWAAGEYGYLRVPFAERGERMDEAIGVLRALWDRPDEPFAGPHVAFAGQKFGPPPVQAGGPEIWVGGNSRVAQRRAARLGDAWFGGTATADPAVYGAACAFVREQAAAQGRQVKLCLSARVGATAGRRTHAQMPVEYPGRSPWIIGWPAESVVRHLRAIEALGCAHVTLNVWEGDIGAAGEGLHRLAEEVLPAFR